jgi:hypothetical protein
VQRCDVAPIPTENIGQRGDPLDKKLFSYFHKNYLLCWAVAKHGHYACAVKDWVRPGTRLKSRGLSLK